MTALNNPPGPRECSPFCHGFSVSKPVSVVAAEICGMDLQKRAVALLCREISVKEGKAVIAEAACFKGFQGEEALEDLFLTNMEFTKKYRGTCDEYCQSNQTNIIKELSTVQSEVETTLRETITKTNEESKILNHTVKGFEKCGELLQNYKAGYVEWVDANNDRVQIEKNINNMIDKSKHLDPEQKKNLKQRVWLMGTRFSPHFDTPYMEIIAETKHEITTMQNKIIDADESRGWMDKNFEKTRRYLQSQWGPHGIGMMGKVGEALTGISTAIPKFASGDPWQVISGITDVAAAISSFLPPPTNAIMGPISTIFGGLFGMGTTSPQEVIKDEMQKLKKYLQKEFEQVEEKLDEVIQEARNNAITELLGDLSNMIQFMGGLQAYVQPIEDMTLNEVEVQAFVGQVNDAFLSPASFQGAKTMTYLDEFCTGKWLNEADSSKVMLPCADLVYAYSKMYVLRNVLFARFIALMRTSPLSRLTESNLRLRDTMTEEVKSFLLTYLSSASNHSSAPVLGCLAGGHSTKLHCFRGGMVSKLQEDKVNFFEFLIKKLFEPDTFKFAECKQHDCREYKNHMNDVRLGTKAKKSKFPTNFKIANIDE